MRPPSGTTTRFFLLIAAVLATGSLAFTALYFAVPEHQNRQQVASACEVRAKAAITPLRTAADVEPYARGLDRIKRCHLPVYRDQIRWVVVGDTAMLGLAGLLYLLHPWWRVRRWRLAELRDVDDPETAQRLDALSRKMGLARPPTWMVSADGGVDGLAFGLPGRRRVMLTAGLLKQAGTDLTVLRAVAGHELAHLRNRDVDVTYLTIALWWAFVAVSLVPTLVVTAHPEVLTDPLGWSPGTLWRTALIETLLPLAVLTAIVVLTRNAILRVREVHADATAATVAGPDGKPVMERTLRHVPESASRFWPGWTRMHPTPEQRRAALASPSMLARPSLWEMAGIGLTAGLFAIPATFELSAALVTRNLLQPQAIIGLVTWLLVTGLLTTTLWRWVADRPQHRPDLRTCLAVPTALVAGFMAGDPLSFHGGHLLWSEESAWWLSLLTYASAGLALTVGMTAVTVWTVSTIRHAPPRTAPIPVTVATVAGALLFISWWQSVSSGWGPVRLGAPPRPAGSSAWYTPVTRLTGTDWPPVQALVFSPAVPVAVLLLSVAPLLTAVRRGSRPSPALRIGLASGLAAASLTIVLVFAAETALPTTVRWAEDCHLTLTCTSFLVAFTDTQIAVMLLVQGVVAFVVAARHRAHRPALVLLATTVSALVATAGSVFVATPLVRWTGLISPPMDDWLAIPGTADFATGTLYTVLVQGLVIVVPCAALGALLSRRFAHTGETPLPGRPAVLAVTAVLVLAAAFRIPTAWTFWA
ncbi:peptidase M48-like protein [Actinomadura pelletieri DSM 43383]|uniref:Peptidase M48-like protein n=1 Tax=Actinomadura pelletieri DSM 43383 TaxID=1120940 RepID=A0A495QGK5_9ACTN|nr:M48 family metalloprotease [Actinomadura pelletieri]RKS71050.1 peptidase M48-like protein [Actinomadura pelletieri DSM 43383]